MNKKLKHQKPWYKRRNIKFVDPWDERTLEESFLTSLHNKASEKELLDLHTYFVSCRNPQILYCPICNEILIWKYVPKGGYGK